MIASTTTPKGESALRSRKAPACGASVSARAPQFGIDETQ